MARPFATPEQRDEVRSRIRLAAGHLYRRDGVSGITARAIAAEAGVSVGAIYAHFDDLASLMQSLWTGHVERQNARFRAVAEAHPEPKARLRALLGAYLQFALENRDLYRNAFLFVRPEGHAKPEPLPLAHYEFPRLLIEALREGQAVGDITPGDPDHLAQLLWSALHGALALPENIDRIAFAPAEAVSPMMLEMLMKAICG